MAQVRLARRPALHLPRQRASINACRYFLKLPVASPSIVQVENTNFRVLIQVLLQNTGQTVGTESRSQLLLKYRFALHLLSYVNEDSRLLVLKIANIEAGLKCVTPLAPMPRPLCSECFGRRSLPSRNTFCARLTEVGFPDLVGPLVLAGMSSGVTPDFTLPRFYVANLVEGMRKRLQVRAASPPPLRFGVKPWTFASATLATP